MNIPERRKYLTKMRPLYWQAQKKSRRDRLSDEMQAAAGLHRKSFLHFLHGDPAHKPRRKQRGKVYGAKVQAVIEDEKTLQLPERIGVATLRRRLPSVPRAAQRMAHCQQRPTPKAPAECSVSTTVLNHCLTA